MHAYLGLLGVSNGSYNELVNLEGQSGSIMEGIDFTASDQAGYGSIDKYYTNETGVVAFTEAGYGNVAVQNEGENGQRTFCLSYSLGDLVDGGYPNQRENVLAKLCQFFDVPLVALAIEDEQILPTATTLLDNYPNPFNPVTVIGFSLPREQHVRLRIYSLAGMHVATLLDSAIPAGTTRVAWDGCDKVGKSAASGVYFYRLETEGFSETKRMMLLK